MPNYKQLQALFIPPEKTPARISFGNPPNKPTFEESRIVVYGVPFDDTATFGKGSDRGPEAIRHTSARQVETWITDERRDIYEDKPVFDLGDLKMRKGLTEKQRKALYDEKSSERTRASIIGTLEQITSQFGVLKDVTRFIRSQGKIPVMLGGEHTLSYWPLSALAHDEKPVVIHFDAHRDAKAKYQGIRLCHTTPMYHAIVECGIPGYDFVQIGIRQQDVDEYNFAIERNIATFDTFQVRNAMTNVRNRIKYLTKGRNVYVTFDIDALDIAYTPCTGTPEPFGLTPGEIVRTLESIDRSARLIGADFVEVGVKNNDFREGTIATQLLLRLFCRDYVK